ncbi:hypothetical protein KOW79_006502 [Hemibagrus wyckioides]|uniref:Secreted protein n=1 Tax=Hemibagrus wyckioides TaxID=337641 RepID=A0A9D3NWT7_9TELE|nr:hypothetical protein KOW79_006502 [Hemibagrus wyckioides]
MNLGSMTAMLTFCITVRALTHKRAPDLSTPPASTCAPTPGSWSPLWHTSLTLQPNPQCQHHSHALHHQLFLP